jgi:23S rRNA-/tRNA-specific pseudouridylate synthase
VSAVIKLSWPATRDYWELPVLFEDEHLLALNKPAGLLTSPDPLAPEAPSLMKLLHAAIAGGKPWARERGLSYLLNAHRLEAESSGVLLLAKSKPILAALGDLFGAEKVVRTFLALVCGAPQAETFEVDAPLAPHPARPGVMHVDRANGLKAKTAFEVVECFDGYALLRGSTVGGRRDQIRAHLHWARLAAAGDAAYGGRPLLLSRLKSSYRLKPDQTERPLLSKPAVHAERMELPHPVTGQPLVVVAPWTKDLMVAVKYLRKYAPCRRPDPTVS